MTILSHTTRTFYNNYSVNTDTYVYTSNASSGANDGWIPSRYDSILVQTRVATLTATSLTVRIEGRSAGYSKVASIYCFKNTGTTSVDRAINIAERVAEIRIGVKIDKTSTPNNFYSGIIFGEVN